MVKTEVVRHEVRRQKRASDIDLPGMLADLNETGQPRGMTFYYRDILGSNAVGMTFAQRDKEDYVGMLRRYVDLWLATGWVEERENPATRHPAPEISLIVERAVRANRVLPAVLPDGYAMAIMYRQPEPEPENWQKDEPRHPAAHAALLAGNPQAVAAAEKAFVTMLLSDWRLKLGKCASPGCETYFALGKWNQVYALGTRCLACRDAQGTKDNQRRVETNRVLARQTLYAYLAARLGRRVVTGRSWYQDPKLKAEVATAVNSRVRQGKEPLWAALYPKGITVNWLASGQQGKKNWLLIEQAALAASSSL